MQFVVADTGPLNYLMLIGESDILPNRRGPAPPAV
jgi:hypothetical protein